MITGICYGEDLSQWLSLELIVFVIEVDTGGKKPLFSVLTTNKENHYTGRKQKVTLNFVYFIH